MRYTDIITEHEQLDELGPLAGVFAGGAARKAATELIKYVGVDAAIDILTGQDTAVPDPFAGKSISKLASDAWHNSRRSTTQAMKNTLRQKGYDI